MADSNGLPPKVYRRLLSSIYLQNLKDAKAIKENWSRNGNPICQKENRYFSPRTKGNILTQEYIKKMSEKPERSHIRRIPRESNLSSSLTVIRDYRKIEGKRLHPELRKNQSSMSAPKIEHNHRQFIKSASDKNFYLDNFNSIKENQNHIDLRKRVSKKIKLLLFILL